MEEVTYEIYPSRQQGGQRVGTGPSGIKASHSCGIIIIIENFRSQHKNKILAQTLMELALGEING